MSEIILEARDVTRNFMISAGFMKPKRTLRAVNGVDLAVARRRLKVPRLHKITGRGDRCRCLRRPYASVSGW